MKKKALTIKVSAFLICGVLVLLIAALLFFRWKHRVLIEMILPVDELLSVL